MSYVHQLVIKHGHQAAREMVSTKHERLCVDIAAEIMAEENERLGITHSGFCLTALPHKKPLLSKASDAEADTWRREGHKVTLVVRSGTDRHGQIIGIPYGSRARMILLYLQTKALQANSPIVELGRSMNDWLDRMGIGDKPDAVATPETPPKNKRAGGNTYAQVRKQAHRISSCALSFFWSGDEVEARQNGYFVRNEINVRRATDASQGDFWRDTVELDPVFFDALKRHPVPLWEPALRRISGKSQAIDIYLWLAYRLQHIDKPTAISWLSLHKQFGSAVSELKHFKQDFIRNLQLALAVYPEARVQEDDKRGFILEPSLPAIPKFRRIIGIGR
jgi:Plasmid encoded RepA protein